ncbi:hypothetical protein [Anaerococcus sp.]|uniref:hypothetical protein n=1 Tax=Anaerococcus sp. TaxID=1872515 RepID=UPI002A750087|nr:hypothetical protein [Anaerococcus sp.]MDY2928301.1 hypothetical protein [Anaerococcus sp.]
MNDDLVQRLITSLSKIGHGGSGKKLNNSVRGENMAMALISKNGGFIYPKDIEEKMGVSSARVAKIIKSVCLLCSQEKFRLDFVRFRFIFKCCFVPNFLI